MPQNLNPANPVAVMPKQLCKSFQEDLRMEALMNQYPDGMQRPPGAGAECPPLLPHVAGLNGTDWVDLRQFYMQWVRQGLLLFQPAGNRPDGQLRPTGNNTIGRYTVVFRRPMARYLQHRAHGCRAAIARGGLMVVQITPRDALGPVPIPAPSTDRGVSLAPRLRDRHRLQPCSSRPHLRSAGPEDGAALPAGAHGRAAVQVRQAASLLPRVRRPEGPLRAGAGRLRAVPLHGV